MMATNTKSTTKANSTKTAVKAVIPKAAKPVAKATGTPKAAPEVPATGKLSQIASAERVLVDASEQDPRAYASKSFQQPEWRW